MDGRDLTSDGGGLRAGSTWAGGGGRQARVDDGKRHRIFDSGHYRLGGLFKTRSQGAVNY